jgi:hypothetical protein
MRLLFIPTAATIRLRRPSRLGQRLSAGKLISVPMTVLKSLILRFSAT